MGFENATPIQEQAIPLILENQDLIACAQTGTGKTAAFLLPILHKISSNESEEAATNALIIVPTRELALQIDQQVEALGYFVGVSSIPVYGGGDSQSWAQQKRALHEGTDIIIATPGRLIAHLNMGYVKLDKLQHFILDEADRMLDMGFYNDILKIVDYIPKERQNLLFSATMPDKIRRLTKKILNDPKQISIAISKPAKGILQAAYLAHDYQKARLVVYLLKGKKNYPSVIIFTSTKKMVNTITLALTRAGLTANGISSDLDQKERELALLDFKNKKTQIIVATDILARGIDIKEISLVINYDVPSDAEDYVHRIGRTARADSTGVALTFISDKDVPKFMRIEQMIEQTVQKVALPPELGEAPEYKASRKGGGGGGYRRNNNRPNNKRRSGGKSSRGRNNRGGSKRS